MPNYEFTINNPNFDNVGHVVAIANIKDKHDRSAPSHYHWKILKCRMIIFSNSSILACPDKQELQQVHIIFNKVGDDYDKINSLFLKFSLVQNGEIMAVTSEMYKLCFQYTMTAKMAPIWNVLGYDYLINNRDFLTAEGPQEGVKYEISTNENSTIIDLKPVKIHVIRSDDDYMPGEWIRVFPSLNKATVDTHFDSLPQSGNFKCYKDLRRHWKNIHGYRLPEEEGPYCAVQFWRGEPLTYPKICLTRNFPIITPIPKSQEIIVIRKFINCVKSKWPHFLGRPMSIYLRNSDTDVPAVTQHVSTGRLPETQTISLCTPTQYQQQHLKRC